MMPTFSNDFCSIPGRNDSRPHLDIPARLLTGNYTFGKGLFIGGWRLYCEEWIYH